MATIEDYQAAYAKAQAAKDAAGMSAAHAGAESIRSMYGYSGGANGSQNIPLGGNTSNSGGYSPLGTYNDNSLASEDQAKIQASKNQYAKAYAAGDTAGMNAAHTGAESVRSQYGYSGGDGSQWIPFQNGQPIKSTTRSANSLHDNLNGLYAAQLQNALAGLKSAYDQNMADVNAAQAKIPETYNTARNQTAATAEQNRANFNELATSRGINSGTGSQAALAQNIAQQNNMTNLNKQEAQANTDIGTQRLKLSTAYNDAIQQAISGNDYQKAQALYNESVRVDNSLVEQSQQQAALDYQYQQATAAQKQQQFENDLSTQNAELNTAMQRAKYGDYSALKSMYGWDDATAQQALYAWKIQSGIINFNRGSGGGRSSGRSRGRSKSGSGGNIGEYHPDNGPSNGISNEKANISSLEYSLEKISSSGKNVSTKAAQEIMRYYHNGLISSDTKDKYLQNYS